MNTFKRIAPSINQAPVGGSYMSGFFTMKNIGLALLAVVLCVVAYYSYKQYTQSTGTFHANREKQPVDEASPNKAATMLLFYADWCPHCKTAKPEWESLKAEYDGHAINGYTVTFAEYNCSENNDENVIGLMDKYSVEGFPTVKLLKDNQIIEYDAKPTKATMEQFLHTVL